MKTLLSQLLAKPQGISPGLKNPCPDTLQIWCERDGQRGSAGHTHRAHPGDAAPAGTLLKTLPSPIPPPAPVVVGLGRTGEENQPRG